MELAVEQQEDDLDDAIEKQSYVVEDLPNLSNIKSKFESEDLEEEDSLNSSGGPVKRSDSVVNKMTKFQNFLDNGVTGQSDDEASEGEQFGEDVIKESREKEKVAFQGLAELKTQWETRKQMRDEEHATEEKEELNKLRMEMSQGKKSVKSVYENALEESSQSASRTSPITVEGGVRALSLRHRFETGELNDEGEEDRYESMRREKEEDLSVVKEPAIANDARCLFKQMDAEVSRGPSSNGVARFPTDTPERKRVVPDREVARDPNIIRSGESEEIIVTDTARKMLNKFRELETQKEEIPQGPKPLKRITPQREFNQTDEEFSTDSPPRDPNIVRACDKVEDDYLVQTTPMAKNLRAKFEHWDAADGERDNSKNAEDLDKEIKPDRARMLTAQFESLKEETSKPKERIQPKSGNRFSTELQSGGAEKCALCDKRVYAMEKIEASGQKFHKTCFKCSQCGHVLRLDNYTTVDSVLYCTPHFMQKFKTKGNYDEGFGRDLHKNKWTQGQDDSRGNGEWTHGEEVTPADDYQYANGATTNDRESHQVNGNEEDEYYNGNENGELLVPA